LQRSERQGNRPLFRHHVRRPRLTRLLDEISAQAIVICAPAGYGKTVLAAEWVLRRPHVAWHRATPASADLAAFSGAIGEVVGRVVAEAAEPPRHEVKSAAAAESDPRVLAELLAAKLANWPQDAILVVDDYHLVQESRPVEEFVDWLLTLSQLRLLVTTRAPPAWASARRMLYGELVEIGRDQLAMTDQEAAAVLRALPERTAREAIARARGWPAVIGLAALSPAAEIPEAALSDALYRYFAEEVLRRESPDVQRFMLLAAVPMTVDAATARDLLGQAGGEEALKRLSGEGLVEAANGSFRFHPLLRDFLRHKLESEAAEDAASLADRSVTFAAERGRFDEAVEVALEHGDKPRAAEIAARAAPDLLGKGRIETIERWLDACGAAALHQPTLQLARAAILIRRGELTDALSQAADVADRAGLHADHASRAWYLKAQALHQLGERRDALACAERARELGRTPEDRMNALVLCTMAAGALELEDADYLGELEQLTGDDLQARFRWLSAEIWSALRRPTLAGVWESLVPLVSLVDSCEGPMLRSDILNGASQLCLLRADYAAAAEFAARAVGVCADFRLRLNHVFALLCLANAQIGRREYRRAERSLRAVRASEYRDRPGVRITYEIAQLKLALVRGQPVPVSTLDEIPRDKTSKRSRGLYAALRALAAAVSEHADGCRTAAATARAESKGVEARFYSRYAGVLAELGSSHPTVELFALLDETAEADVLDAFVTAYRADSRVLAAAAADPRAATVARRAVLAGGDRSLAREAGLAEDGPGGRRGDLTRRELEVLELMTDGLSNAEIARRLYISPSTTKVHVHHILEKLESKSRFEAVLKAKARE
jgi:ATP/maltotriose-dependent transcriptional regulator MalT